MPAGSDATAGSVMFSFDVENHASIGVVVSAASDTAATMPGFEPGQRGTIAIPLLNPENGIRVEIQGSGCSELAVALYPATEPFTLLIDDGAEDGTVELGGSEDLQHVVPTAVELARRLLRVAAGAIGWYHVMNETRSTTMTIARSGWFATDTAALRRDPLGTYLRPGEPRAMSFASDSAARLTPTSSFTRRVWNVCFGRRTSCTARWPGTTPVSSSCSAMGSPRARASVGCQGGASSSRPSIGMRSVRWPRRWRTWRSRRRGAGAGSRRVRSSTCPAR